MRRFTSFILCLALVLSLAACGKPDDSTPQDKTPSSGTEDTVPTTPTTPSTDEKDPADAGKTIGAIGIIGPCRMDYSRVLATIDKLSDEISRLSENNLLPGADAKKDKR